MWAAGNLQRPQQPLPLHLHQQRVKLKTTCAAGNCWNSISSARFRHVSPHIDASLAPGPAPTVAQNDELLIHVPVRLDGEAAVGDTGRSCRRLYWQWQAADSHSEWLKTCNSRGLTAAERLPRDLLPGRVRYHPPYREVPHRRRHKRYVIPVSNAISQYSDFQSIRRTRARRSLSPQWTGLDIIHIKNLG
jgi:hypothetical protein